MTDDVSGQARSDTPRTDDAAADELTGEPLELVAAQFARRLERELSALKRELEEAKLSRDHTQQWYAERLQWLQVWFRTDGKDLPVANQFWNIIANGTPSIATPPTYQQQLNMAKHRADKAESALAESQAENGRLRVLLAKVYSGPILYGDDGELQDNLKSPFIDFKRDSADGIEHAMLMRARAALAKEPTK